LGVKKLVRSWWLLVIPAGVALGAITTYVATFHHLPATENPGAWGTFGDYFGGLLNPLISALTLFVAIRVWQLQKQELAETRKAMEEQAKTAEQQRQEQRFFDLLNVYQQTVGAIFVVARMPSTGGEYPVQYSGKEAVAQYVRGGAAEQLRHFDESGYGAWTQQINQVKRREDLIPFWCTEVTKSLFDHYFRVVFRILSEAEALLNDQHIRYIELFHAQLSRSELIILAYNLWLDDEGKKMIPLAEKYGLLKHLPKGHLRTTLEQELPPLIFGRIRAAELASEFPACSTKETA
jgi:large-conductance mechanosensitive channel